MSARDTAVARTLIEPNRNGMPEFRPYRYCGAQPLEAGTAPCAAGCGRRVDPGSLAVCASCRGLEGLADKQRRHLKRCRRCEPGAPACWYGRELAAAIRKITDSRPIAGETQPTRSQPAGG